VETIFVLLPLALLIAAIAVAFFIWAARTGQFDDLDTPAVRILFDDDEPQPRTGRDSPAPVRRSVVRPDEASANGAKADARSAVASAKAETRRVLR
jgi:cbb3-type cytochrome oxidase maturation protein